MLGEDDHGAQSFRGAWQGLSPLRTQALSTAGKSDGIRFIRLIRLIRFIRFIDPSCFSRAFTTEDAEEHRGTADLLLC